MSSRKNSTLTLSSSTLELATTHTKKLKGYQIMAASRPVAKTVLEVIQLADTDPQKTPPDITLIKKIYQSNQKLNSYDEQKNTALHLAVQNGFTGVVEWLVRKGASLSSRNQETRTPLQLAILSSHKTDVKLKLITLLLTENTSAAITSLKDLYYFGNNDKDKLMMEKYKVIQSTSNYYFKDEKTHWYNQNGVDYLKHNCWLMRYPYQKLLSQEEIYPSTIFLTMMLLEPELKIKILTLMLSTLHKESPISKELYASLFSNTIHSAISYAVRHDDIETVKLLLSCIRTLSANPRQWIDSENDDDCYEFYRVEELLCNQFYPEICQSIVLCSRLDPYNDDDDLYAYKTEKNKYEYYNKIQQYSPILLLALSLSPRSVEPLIQAGAAFPSKTSLFRKLCSNRIKESEAVLIYHESRIDAQNHLTLNTITEWTKAINNTMQAEAKINVKPTISIDAYATISKFYDENHSDFSRSRSKYAAESIVWLQKAATEEHTESAFRLAKRFAVNYDLKRADKSALEQAKHYFIMAAKDPIFASRANNELSKLDPTFIVADEKTTVVSTHLAATGFFKGNNKSPESSRLITSITMPPGKTLSQGAKEWCSIM